MNRHRGRNVGTRFINRIPFGFRTCKINIGQATTIIERILANARDAVGNRYARQATAIIERIFANARDTSINRNHTIFTT